MFKKGDSLNLYGNTYKVLTSDQKLTLTVDSAGNPAAFPTNKLVKILASQLKKAIAEKEQEPKAEETEAPVNDSIRSTFEKFTSLINSKVPANARKDAKEALNTWLEAREVYQNNKQALEQQKKGKLTRSDMSKLEQLQTAHEDLFESLKQKVIQAIKTK